MGEGLFTVVSAYSNILFFIFAASISAQSTLKLCPSLVVNPTYTAQAPLPSDFTWGCSPGTICVPPKPGCDIWEGPPDDSYYCSPDECIMSPDFTPPTNWGPDIESNITSKYIAPPEYFNLVPTDFGLGYDMFFADSAATPSLGPESVTDAPSSQPTEGPVADSTISPLAVVSAQKSSTTGPVPSDPENQPSQTFTSVSGSENPTIVTPVIDSTAPGTILKTSTPTVKSPGVTITEILPSSSIILPETIMEQPSTVTIIMPDETVTQTSPSISNPVIVTLTLSSTVSLSNETIPTSKTSNPSVSKPLPASSSSSTLISTSTSASISPPNWNSTTSTFTSTSVSISTSSTTSETAIATPFILAMNYVPSARKRQQNSQTLYVGAGGVATTDCSAAALFAIESSQLYSGSLQVSISTKQALSPTGLFPVAVSSPVQAIKGNFTVSLQPNTGNVLLWTSNAFMLSQAAFCYDTGYIQAAFTNSTLTTCLYKSDLLVIPASDCSSTINSARSINRKRQMEAVPAVCYNECNNCYIEAQKTGKSPELCKPSSAFQQQYGACEQCVNFHSQNTKRTLTGRIATEFQQFLGYCAGTPALAQTGSSSSSSSNNIVAPAPQPAVSEVSSSQNGVPLKVPSIGNVIASILALVPPKPSPALADSSPTVASSIVASNPQVASEEDDQQVAALPEDVSAPNSPTISSPENQNNSPAQDPQPDASGKKDVNLPTSVTSTIANGGDDTSVQGSQSNTIALPDSNSISSGTAVVPAKGDVANVQNSQTSPNAISGGTVPGQASTPGQDSQPNPNAVSGSVEIPDSANAIISGEGTTPAQDSQLESNPAPEDANSLNSASTAVSDGQDGVGPGSSADTDLSSQQNEVLSSTSRTVSSVASPTDAGTLPSLFEGAVDISVRINRSVSITSILIFVFTILM